MKDLLFWLEIALFAAACLLAIGGQRLQQPSLIMLAVMVFGVLAVVLGAEVFVKRRASFLSRRAGHVTGSEQYSGVAAQIWGIFFVLAGVLCILAAIAGLLMPDRAQAVIEQALETPAGWGMLAVVAGTFLGLYGLTRVLAGGAATVRGLTERLRDTGYRLFGALCLLVGLGIVALGLMLILSPEMLAEPLRRWLPQVP
jgi:hypothetical protein